MLRGTIGIAEADFAAAGLDDVKVVAYQMESERNNEGINNRWRGISETVDLIRAAIPAERYFIPEDVAEACDSGSNCFIIALGIGALNDLRGFDRQIAVITPDFACGDDMDEEIPHYGQHVWSQGVGSCTQVITGARAFWPTLIGNPSDLGTQIGDPRSLKPPERVCFPYGLYISFGSDDHDAFKADINNLGGSPGPGSSGTPQCKSPVPNGVEPPPGGCPCGCGCGCTDDVSPAGLEQRILFSQVAQVYDGTSNEPASYLVPFARQPRGNSPALW